MTSLYNRYVPPKKQKPPPEAPAAPPPKERSIQNASTGSLVSRGEANAEGNTNALYARYVPPKPSSPPPASPVPLKGESIGTPERKRKRKRHDDEPIKQSPEIQKSSHQASPVSKLDNGARSQTDASPRTSALHPSATTEQPELAPESGAHSTPEKQHRNSKKSKSTKTKKKKSDLLADDGRRPERDVDTEASRDDEPSKKSRQSDDQEGTSVVSRYGEASRSKSHESVLAKFQKSATRASTRTDNAEDEHSEREDEPVERPQINELQPIPLPPSKLDTERPDWSALPTWLSEPTIVPLDAVQAFHDIGITGKSLALLRRENIEKTLPVQTGVLPLLLPRPAQHPGDVCVSAATGSGKTLSYVVPIMEQIQPLPIPQLRAIIIVPTRELVSQVFATCETFAKEFDLKVGTAVGNRSMKEEQSALVEPAIRYDPEAYSHIASKLNRSYHTAQLDDSDLEDEEQLLGLKRHEDLLPGHVPTYFSRLDVLIATPGRLVEHIRATRGFDLTNLRWLVIDEADRLLDQSFQEWADIVTSALDSKVPDDVPAPFTWDPILSGLFLPKIRFPARKVILSATMTSDLDKLSLLKLRNPKLIVVQGSESSDDRNRDDAAAARGEQQAIAGVLTLPTTLEEFAVPVGDGSEKPLYLVSLLQRIMGDHIVGVKPSSRPSSTLQASSDEHEPESSPDVDIDTDESSSVSSSSVSSDSSSSESDTSSVASSVDSDADTKMTDATATNPTPQPPSVLIFTSTNEATTRLHSLLSNLLPALASQTAALTRTTSAATTAKHLAHLRAGRLRVLLASDRASRGLDVPALTDVISYDLPRSVAAYVHRAGRTARAGRPGCAWTLTERRGAGWFWHVVARGDAPARGVEQDVRIRRDGGRKVRKVRLEDVGGQGMRARYEEALGRLKQDVLGQ